jgi:hypothetical protein
MAEEVLDEEYLGDEAYLGGLQALHLVINAGTAVQQSSSARSSALCGWAGVLLSLTPHAATMHLGHRR